MHVGIGTWVIPTFLLFEHRLWAVVPPACFVVVNALSHRFQLIQSVEGEPDNVGTILYPLSVAACLGLFWVHPWPVVGGAAVLVMAWGDAAGSLVGRRFGRHGYEVLGHRRSWEGTAAVFVAGGLGILASWLVFGQPLAPSAVLAILLAAGVGTLLEAVSLWGFDNLLVPAGVAVTLVLAYGSLWG